MFTKKMKKLIVIYEGRKTTALSLDTKFSAILTLGVRQQASARFGHIVCLIAFGRAPVITGVLGGIRKLSTKLRDNSSHLKL